MINTQQKRQQMSIFTFIIIFFLTNLLPCTVLTGCTDRKPASFFRHGVHAQQGHLYVRNNEHSRNIDSDMVINMIENLIRYQGWPDLQRVPALKLATPHELQTD